MADSTTSGAPAPRPSRRNTTGLLVVTFTLFLPLLLSILVAVLLYQDDSFSPAALPMQEISGPPLAAPVVNGRMKRDSELIDKGGCSGPEDLAYDGEEKVIYTGCGDGWIRKIKVDDSVGNMVVEKWVNTGGRPLGLAFGRSGEVIVADTELVGIFSRIALCFMLIKGDNL